MSHVQVSGLPLMSGQTWELDEGSAAAVDWGKNPSVSQGRSAVSVSLASWKEGVLTALCAGDPLSTQTEAIKNM